MNVTDCNVGHPSERCMISALNLTDCNVGIRQDDELILEKHSRPLALPIDEMDDGHLGCSTCSQHAWGAEQLIRDLLDDELTEEMHIRFTSTKVKEVGRMSARWMFPVVHAWAEVNEAGRMCRSYSDETVGVLFSNFMCVLQ